MALPTCRPTLEPMPRMADLTMASAGLWRRPPPPVSRSPRTPPSPPEAAGGASARAGAGLRRLAGAVVPPIRREAVGTPHRSVGLVEAVVTVPHGLSGS